ncbi:MAG: hypothetical protein CL534_23365 [Ahrensia sp.]|nr:hypothetical protein [Ahrensia sp.]
MSTDLFEIECWRERWFYKIGSRYTGPFASRRAAAKAAEDQIGPLFSAGRRDGGRRGRCGRAAAVPTHASAGR